MWTRPLVVMSISGAEPAWPWALGSAAQGCDLGRFFFPLSSQSHASHLATPCHLLPGHRLQEEPSGTSPSAPPSRHPCMGTETVTISLWPNVIKVAVLTHSGKYR